jgi:PIN domain nuclease of toxin-antitoxin system
MRFLLDTHALLWWLFNDPGLSANARDIITDPENAILVSSASAWEIATKHRLGRLSAASELARDVAGWIERAGMAELLITIPHAQRAGNWAQSHRDPFDRLLAAQSAIEDVPLITRDPAFGAFAIRTVW